MGYPCTWCGPLVQQLCSHREARGLLWRQPRAESLRMLSFYDRQTEQRTLSQNSLVETVLIRRVQNEKNLSDGARQIWVYSAFELRETIKCFQYQTSTKQQIQFGCSGGAKQSNLHFPQSWKYWTWWTQVGVRIHEILSPLSAFICTLLYTLQMYKQSQVPACFCRCTERFYETSSPLPPRGLPPANMQS